MIGPDYIGDWERYVEMQKRAAAESCASHRQSVGLDPDDEKDVTDCVSRPCWQGCPFEASENEGAYCER